MLKKLGVNTEGLSPHITSRFGVIDHVFLRHAGREGIITSGNDGQHMLNSLHYKGRAIDLRTKDLSERTIKAILDDLCKMLGPNYDVLFETTHIHLEFDPK